MKTNELLTEQLPESLYSVEMEERLETINLPAEALIENCCTEIFSPCLCICDCNSPTDDGINVVD
jgi:hypothetical protein